MVRSTVNGAIVTDSGGAQGITKTGGGTLALTANKTYAGDTNVTAGTLALASSTSNNNIATSPTITVDLGATLDVSGITASGGFEVVNGQMLVGEGTVIGATTILGKLSPGDTAVGTLDFVNNLDFKDAESLLFDLGTSSDLVDLTSGSGTLTIGPSLGVSDFDFTQGAGFGFGVYTLFNTPMTISGDLGDTLVMFSPTVIGVLSFDGASDQNLILTVASVPEPSACLLAVLGVLGLGLVGWRRDDGS